MKNKLKVIYTVDGVAKEERYKSFHACSKVWHVSSPTIKKMCDGIPIIHQHIRQGLPPDITFTYLTPEEQKEEEGIVSVPIPKIKKPMVAVMDKWTCEVCQKTIKYVSKAPHLASIHHQVKVNQGTRAT